MEHFKSHILMISPNLPPFFGGAGIQSGHLAVALARQGVNVEFVTNNYDQPSIIDTYRNIKTYRFNSASPRRRKLGETIFHIKTAWHILWRPRYRILHFHSITGPDILMFPFYKLLGRKLIVKLTLMGSDDPRTMGQRKLGWLYTACLKSVDRFVAISTALYNATLEQGLPEHRVLYLSNGVDVEQYFMPSREDRSRIRAKLGVQAYSNVFVSVGQVEFRKGYDLLIDAFERISHRMPNSILLIAGPGNVEGNLFYHSLKEKLRRRELKNVRFLGRRNDVPEILQAADCFLFCSRSEGQPNVLIEAMASGVPVVTMEIDGITQDIVSDRRIGRVCHSRKPEDFSRIVGDFMAELSAEEVRQAALDVQQRYNINKLAADYVGIYSEMTSSRPETDGLALASKSKTKRKPVRRTAY